MSARIAVVMVNYRTASLALAALRALAGERAAHPDLEAIVVDGGSGDGSAEMLAQGLRNPAFAGWTSLLPLDINGGFGWANNQAMLRLLQRADPPEYIHLLNPDAEVEPGAVTRLAEALDRHPECSAVGSLLIDPDGTPSGSAFSFPSIGAELMRGARIGALQRLLRLPPPALLGIPAQEVDWATGASVMLRAAALRETGLFDTGFFLYFEEVELMWRMARAGWTIRHEPASRVRHLGGAATGVNGSLRVERRPPLPPYWYASRRRFLALTRSRAQSLAASLAWLGGHATLALRQRMGRARQHIRTDEDARRLREHGLLPDRRDRTPAAPDWDEPPGKPPAWMAGPVRSG